MLAPEESVCVDGENEIEFGMDTKITPSILPVKFDLFYLKNVRQKWQNVNNFLFRVVGFLFFVKHFSFF